MKQKPIAVIGASGFVGSALCERLHAEGRRYFACVRSRESANRVARMATPIRHVDLLDPDQIAAALTGCFTVVNCALGDELARTKGLENLLDCAKKTGIEKLIHLSDTAIYGEDPGPECISEDGQPNPAQEEVGIYKLKQDRLVLKLKNSSVAAYVLCPGNITGPYAPFLRRIIERLNRGPLPLVDGGQYPSNLTHIDNLVAAILSAIDSNNGAGERYFVNEIEPISWKRIFDDIVAMTGINCEFVDVSRDKVLAQMSVKKQNGGVASVVLSREFREEVSRLPVLEWMDRQAKRAYRQLPEAQRRALREKLRWPLQVESFPSNPPLDERFVRMQIKRYRHSPAKLQKDLDWTPPLNYERGLEITKEWLKFSGLDTRYRAIA